MNAYTRPKRAPEQRPGRHLPLHLALLVVFVLAISAPFRIHAADGGENRVALVIGNSSYEHSASLANPNRDAEAIANKLQALGFDVHLHSNLDGQGFRVALGAFTEQTQNADIALVFYAGHGIEMEGKNYLIPTDAAMRSEATAQFETISLDQVLSTVRGAKKLGMVLLDACRDNPFAASMTRKNGTRAVSRGLAPVSTEGESGVLVSFAAQEGATASDGDGLHSPYTTALLNVIDTPGLEIGRMFRKLRAQVKRATNGEQVPIESMQLPDADIYLKLRDATAPVSGHAGDASAQNAAPPVGEKTALAPRPQTAPQTAPQPLEDPLIVFLNAVKSGDRAQLEAFVQRYPNHTKAKDARRLLETFADRDFWTSVKERDTLEAYREYALVFSTGEFIRAAEAKIAKLSAPQTTPKPTVKPTVNSTTSQASQNTILVPQSRQCPALVGGYGVQLIRSNDTLFVRSGPGKNNPVVGELPFNASGVITRNCAPNQWCMVTYGCVQGYSYGKYLAQTQNTAAKSDFRGAYRVSHHPLNEKLNVRAGPGTQYRVVAELPPTATGVQVEDCQIEQNYSYRWCHLSWRDLSGWAYGKYLSDARGARPRK